MGKKQKVWRYIPLAVILLIFAVLAGRIAFATKGFLPFDEAFHMGLIQMHAHHWSPLLTGNDPGSSTFGAVARDPSYLYHYLLSFPYRITGIFTHNFATQLLVLRAVNIAFGMLTLTLLFVLARRSKLPLVAAYAATLTLAILPVFYDVSAQVNYDNLLIPVVLASLLVASRVRQDILSGNLHSGRIMGLFSLLAFGSLVKYSFLPVAAALAVYLAFSFVRQLGVQPFAGQIKGSFRAMRARTQLFMVALVAVSGGLWLQMYGGNLISYHSLHPQCDAVLSVQTCSNYGPWERNYELHQSRADRGVADNSLMPFTRYWARSMYLDLFSIVHAEGQSTVSVPVMSLRVMAKYVVVGSVLCILLMWRQLRVRASMLGMMVLVSMLYVAILWTQNYLDFQNLHAIVAIQGRYLLPLLPMVLVVAALAVSLVLRQVIALAREYRSLPGMALDYAKNLVLTTTWLYERLVWRLQLRKG